MNNIKTSFSIKDLENLSGIKAHTIRIWEKRYKLFEPNRTETNIRYYSSKSLQKLLNISFLNKNGYKVSKIAKLSEIEIPEIVKSIAEKQNSKNNYIDQMKFAMLNFDQELFYKTYEDLENKYSFIKIFDTVFIPLLDIIGMLWQTNTITPAHEHFIVELIKQKIVIATNLEANNKKRNTIKYNTAYVLFLPEGEMHELGLLYINYILSNKALNNIYLGQSVPNNSLKHICEIYDQVTFISVFTLKPDSNDLDKYFNTYAKDLFNKNNNKLLISSHFADSIDNKKLHPNISIYKTSKELVEKNFNLETV